MIYTGWVTLDGEPLAYKLGGQYRAPEKLDPRSDLRRYSETGFRPSSQHDRLQLALALLADCLNDDAEALAQHENFHSRIVAQLPDDWTLTPEQVREAINSR
jgi:Family of unknown function (DUF6166)